MTSLTRRFKVVDYDSPLAQAIRESVREYCWEKSNIGMSIENLLLQYPEASAPLVLAALDCLAGEGVIALVPSACGVGVEWRRARGGGGMSVAISVIGPSANAVLEAAQEYARR